MRTKGRTGFYVFAATLFFLLCGTVLPAQEIHLSIDKKTIGFNETATLTLEGELRDVTSFGDLPQSDGVVVVGQTSNYSQNMSNGKIRFRQTFTIQPLKTGTFSLGPAWMAVGSRRVYSNPVSVTITGTAQDENNNLVFLRCDPDHKTAYIGQQVTLTLRLYFRGSSVYMYDNDRPMAKAFNGFWYHDGPDERNYKEDTVITVNGIKYVGKPIYKEYVYPNATGKLMLPSYDYNCMIKQNPFPSGDPMVDELMGIEVPVHLTSPEVPITVLPLPDEKQPASFMGDVGHYSLGAALDRSSVKANEAVELKVTITGNGNIGFIQLPAQHFPDGVEAYPPTSTDTSEATQNGVEGTKTFSFTLIPKKEGKYKIEGITFSYFDPKKKEYITLQTPEFNLEVAPGDPVPDVSENNLPGSFLSQKSSGKTLRNILLIVVPPLLLVLALVFVSLKKAKKKSAAALAAKQEQEALETAQVLPQKKGPDLPAMLSVAEQFYMRGNLTACTAQLYETLLTAVCHSCELSREEASVHQLKFRLNLKKGSAELTQEITSFLEELSLARYDALKNTTYVVQANMKRVRAMLAKLG